MKSRKLAHDGTLAFVAIFWMIASAMLGRMFSRAGREASARAVFIAIAACPP